MKLNFKVIYESAVSEISETNPVFKELTKQEVEQLLPEIDSYNANKHYSRKRFEKSFTHVCRYFGLFDDSSKCVALLSVVENNPKPGITYFDELAGFKPGKGYGISLLKQCMKMFPECWWMASPDGGDSLANNYRKIPGVEEFIIKKSCYKYLPIHCFLKISDKSIADELKKDLLKTWTGEQGKNKNKN